MTLEVEVIERNGRRTVFDFYQRVVFSEGNPDLVQHE